MFKISNLGRFIQKLTNRIYVLGIFRINLFEKIEKNKKILSTNLHILSIHKKIKLKMELIVNYQTIISIMKQILQIIINTQKVA